MKKKDVISKNYLDKIPIRPNEINWSKDDEGMVTLDIENKGFFNMLAQKFFHKPESVIFTWIRWAASYGRILTVKRTSPVWVFLSKRNSAMRPIRCMNVWLNIFRCWTAMDLLYGKVNKILTCVIIKASANTDALIF